MARRRRKGPTVRRNKPREPVGKQPQIPHVEAHRRARRRSGHNLGRLHAQHRHVVIRVKLDQVGGLVELGRNSGKVLLVRLPQLAENGSWRGFADHNEVA